jgi:hypothetical protein
MYFTQEEECSLQAGRYRCPPCDTMQPIATFHLSPSHAVQPGSLFILFPAFWHLPMRFAAALICRRRHRRMMMVTSTIAVIAAVQRLVTPHETSEQ